MYGNTITLFNKYTDSTGDIQWYPTVLTGVDLIKDQAANTAKTGLDDADSANLHIRYTASGDVLYIGGIKYLSPKEYAAQDDPADTLTLAEGDFFAEGSYSFDSPISDADYATRKNGGFYDYMNKAHDHVYLITTVSGAYTLIPHFEIGGR